GPAQLASPLLSGRMSSGHAPGPSARPAQLFDLRLDRLPFGDLSVDGGADCVLLGALFRLIGGGGGLEILRIQKAALEDGLVRLELLDLRHDLVALLRKGLETVGAPLALLVGQLAGAWAV